MRYYKLISGGFLLSVGTGGNTGEEITEAEYNTIQAAIRNKPTALEGYAYRLTATLAWEQYENPVVEVEEKAIDADYLSALSEFGVEV